MLQGTLIPFFIGLIIVLQGGLNRDLSHTWGLGKTTFFNNVIALIISILLLWWCTTPMAPDIFRTRGNLSTLSWWALIPGFCGVIIVAGIPFSIARFGALKTIIILTCAQILGSILWDQFVEKIPVDLNKILASLLAIGSIILVTWKKSA